MYNGSLIDEYTYCSFPVFDAVKLSWALNLSRCIIVIFVLRYGYGLDNSFLKTGWNNMLQWPILRQRCEILEYS